MTKEETKKAIEVMQAYVDGKDLEQINGTGGYSRNYCPKWNWDDDPKCYRIKPEPHYRPFKSAEEVMEAIKEHGDWVKYDTYFDRIVTLDKNSVNTVCANMDYGTALNKYLFLDGTPFGKLED